MKNSINTIAMEESIEELLELVQPGESKKYPGIADLSLTWKYLPALSPNPKNVRIFYRLLRLRDQSSPKASLCLVHGFAEHSGRLINIAIYFGLAGFEVHMIDLRSYGLSGGARAGHNLLEFQKDIQLLLLQARPELPCFLWGHSMGGLLVSTICMNNPGLQISGAVISAPLFDSSSAKVSRLKEVLMKIMAGAVNEGLFNSYIAPSCLSRDDLFTRNVFSDPKLMPIFGPELGLSIYMHMKNAKLQAARLKAPVIFYHGDGDILTSWRTTEEVFKKSTSTDKTFKKLPGVYHEPHHDLDRDQFLADAMAWITPRIQGKALGRIDKFVVGMAGLPRSSNTWKYAVFLVILLYLLVAWKIKVRLTPLKMMSVFKYLSKLFWPLALLVR